MENVPIFAILARGAMNVYVQICGKKMVMEIPLLYLVTASREYKKVLTYLIKGEKKMIKIPVNGTIYFVGDGVELRRLWKKAIKKGYYSYYMDEPRYHLAGTYCIFFDGEEIHWDNFNKVVRNGVQHFNKTIPYYQCFHGIENGLNDARFIYNNRKMNRKYRF